MIRRPATGERRGFSQSPQSGAPGAGSSITNVPPTEMPRDPSSIPCPSVQRAGLEHEAQSGPSRAELRDRCVWRFLGGEEAVADDAMSARQPPAGRRARPFAHLLRAVGKAPVLRKPCLGLRMRQTQLQGVFLNVWAPKSLKMCFKALNGLNKTGLAMP